MDKARLALFTKRKQKYQNGNINRKLKVPTSEREGKLSKPRARRAWRKFTEIQCYGNPRARAARALFIDFLLVIGTVSIFKQNLLPIAYTVELTGTELAHQTRAAVARGIS